MMVVEVATADDGAKTSQHDSKEYNDAIKNHHGITRIEVISNKSEDVKLRKSEEGFVGDAMISALSSPVHSTLSRPVIVHSPLKNSSHRHLIPHSKTPSEILTPPVKIEQEQRTEKQPDVVSGVIRTTRTAKHFYVVPDNSPFDNLNRQTSSFPVFRRAMILPTWHKIPILSTNASSLMAVAKSQFGHDQGPPPSRISHVRTRDHTFIKQKGIADNSWILPPIRARRNTTEQLWLQQPASSRDLPVTCRAPTNWLQMKWARSGSLQH